MKETHFIGRKAGTTLLHSARTAASIGRPFTKVVVINFWQLGSTAETIFDDFAALRNDWFARWSKRSAKKRGGEITALANGEPTWTYVHENTNEHVHTHWMVHISSENEKRFRVSLEKRLRHQFRLKEVPFRAISIKDAYRPEGAKLYMAKGLQKVYADAWKIDAEDCGRICKRRADSSRNIGPSVWKPLKAAWKANRRRAA